MSRLAGHRERGVRVLGWMSVWLGSMNSEKARMAKRKQESSKECWGWTECMQLGNSRDGNKGFSMLAGVFDQAN